MLQFAEVRLAQPVQRGPVELRRPAHEIVDLGLEGLAVLVVPGVFRDVTVVDEDGRSIPVLDLPGQPVAALEDQYPFAR